MTDWREQKNPPTVIKKNKNQIFLGKAPHSSDK